MEKTINAFDARRNFGKILQDVLTNNDKVIVERHGEPVAAVVSIQVYKQWLHSREEAFETLRRLSEQGDPMSEEEANELIEEAKKAVRSGLSE